MNKYESVVIINPSLEEEGLKNVVQKFTDLINQNGKVEKVEELGKKKLAYEIKIAELENKLRYAKIIDESEIDTKTVQVGNIVKVLDMEFDEEESYTIVGSTEVDLDQNKISNESPIGSALLGAKKNEIVEAKTPGGILKLKVLSITK